MMTDIIIFLWTVFLIITICILIRNNYNKREKYYFQNYTAVEIPYITIDVQGQPLNFIVDSGAAVSMITQRTLGHISYEPSPRKIEISATTNESIPANTVTIPITIKGNTIKEDFIVHSTDDLANFMVMHGIEAHGILGNEFFEKTKCRIDFKNHVVII